MRFPIPPSLAATRRRGKKNCHLLGRKGGIVGSFTNCRGITGRRIGRRRCSKLQVRADALMAARERDRRERRSRRRRKRRRRRREREEEEERERSSMSFLVCDVLLPVRDISSLMTGRFAPPPPPPRTPFSSRPARQRITFFALPVRENFPFRCAPNRASGPSRRLPLSVLRSPYAT